MIRKRVKEEETQSRFNSFFLGKYDRLIMSLEVECEYCVVYQGHKNTCDMCDRDTCVVIIGNLKLFVKIVFSFLEMPRPVCLFTLRSMEFY